MHGPQERLDGLGASDQCETFDGPVAGVNVGIPEMGGEHLDDVVGGDAAIAHEAKSPERPDFLRMIGRLGGAEQVVKTSGVLG